MFQRLIKKGVKEERGGRGEWDDITSHRRMEAVVVRVAMGLFLHSLSAKGGSIGNRKSWWLKKSKSFLMPLFASSFHSATLACIFFFHVFVDTRWCRSIWKISWKE